MLYFRFNTDKFIAPQQECIITEYKDGETISSSYKQLRTVDLGTIEEFFFKKLNDELCLSEIGIANTLYDVVEIPVDSFNINDEVVGNLDGVLKFTLSVYEKLPIKELNNKSLSDLGIKIEFCKRDLNKNVNSKIRLFMQENNLKYTYEEVLWKNMTDEEKINKFSENFIVIGSKDKELIIVDPYIFSSQQDDYCEMLSSILNLSGADTIIVVTDKKNYNIISSDKVIEKTEKTIDIKFNNDFHDRFWIANRKKGFYTGTSFNGLGKKISLVNMLSDDEVTDIIDELCKQSII